MHSNDFIGSEIMHDCTASIPTYCPFNVMHKAVNIRVFILLSLVIVTTPDQLMHVHNKHSSSIVHVYVLASLSQCGWLTCVYPFFIIP